MRLDFRQGVVSHQIGGFLLVNAGNVDLLANTRSITVTIADKDSNYTHTEDNTIVGAWAGPFIPAVDYWLYWDFDTITFERTFGSTLVEPIAQPSAPLAPTIGLVWFDTTKNEMFEWTGSGFTKVYRVFAAKLNTVSFFSESINAPSFTGTQVGNTTSARSGRVLFTENGKVLRRDNGTFFTTEDQFFTNQSTIAAIRLEANVARAKCSEPAMSQFSVVAYSAENTIRTAQYDDIGTTVLAVLSQDLIVGEVGGVLIQGVVTNTSWDFSSLPIGSPLWVLNGILVSQNPHITNVITYPTPRVPVARVLGRDTVVFEQGLGGVGPKGPPGDVGNLPPATVSTLGAVVLSTAPTNPSFPIVVGTNDPRLVGGPFAPAGHVHTATEISFTPSGGLIAANVQTALSELDLEKLALAGGTMTGTLILNSDPVTALEAATKQYVDGLVAGLAWLDPVIFANLIDDSLNTPPATPERSDVYIVGPTPTGAWVGLAGNIVQWDGLVWIDHGPLSAQPIGTRFGISMESGTAAGGTFAGNDDFIYTLVGVSTFDAGTAPTLNAAVFVNNATSLHAYHQYVYNGTEWIEFGGAQPITVDGTTIIQSGNVISTKTYATGGTVDAATYRGVDAATLFAPIVHSHTGASITLTAPYTGIDFGTPAILGDNQLVGANVASALQELFDKKANKEPSYATFADLPVASNVAGMIAEVLADGKLYIARGGNWLSVAVNDGTVQVHDHELPYDISMFVAGPAAATGDEVVGSFLVPRPLTMIAIGAALFGRCAVAPLASVTFDVRKNGVSFGSVVFPPGATFVSGGVVAGPVAFPASAQSFAPGDLIELVAPSTPETTITGVSVTIIACGNMGTCPPVVI